MKSQDLPVRAAAAELTGEFSNVIASELAPTTA
jgi:hypothetical protein